MSDWHVRAVVDGETHDGFILAKNQDEAIRAFLSDQHGEVEEAYAERIHHIIVQRLRDYEAMDDPWGVGFEWNLLSTITDEEVSNATIPYDTIVHEDRSNDPRWHAARIVYLTRNQDRLLDPIEVDNECHGGHIYPIPKIVDGWHRFFAHIHLGYTHIRCSYGGLVDLLEYLEGETDVIPEF